MTMYLKKNLEQSYGMKSELLQKQYHKSSAQINSKKDPVQHKQHLKMPAYLLVWKLTQLL